MALVMRQNSVEDFRNQRSIIEVSKICGEKNLPISREVCRFRMARKALVQATLRYACDATLPVYAPHSHQ